jgi:hypothetical protein
MNNSTQPLARKEGLIIQELPEEVLVYDSSSDKAHCLNHTAALVWKYCDRELNTPIKEELVWLALDQLEKETLLEKETQFSLKSFGVSRREVIKRIGLASVVALPIVTSLLNPMSASAANCTVSCAGVPQANIPAICATAVAPNCQAVCLSAGTCAPV